MSKTALNELFGELRAILAQLPVNVSALLGLLRRARALDSMRYDASWLSYLDRLPPITLTDPDSWQETMRCLPTRAHVTLHFEGTLDEDEQLVELAHDPLLSRIRALRIMDQEPSLDAALALAKSPHMGRLTRLSMEHNRLDPEFTATLARNPALHDLEELILWDNLNDTTSLYMLGASESLPSLKHLDLGWNELGEHAITSLARRKSLPALACIVLSENDIRQSVREFARHPSSGSLTSLTLDNTNIAARDVQILARSAHLDRVTEIDLSGNHHISDRDGAPSPYTELLSSPARRITHLDVSATELMDEDMRAIAQCAGARHLRALYARLHALTDEGILAIAQSEHLSSLEHLDLSTVTRCHISEGAIDALLRATHLSDTNINLPAPYAMRGRGQINPRLPIRDHLDRGAS